MLQKLISYEPYADVIAEIGNKNSLLARIDMVVRNDDIEIALDLVDKEFLVKILDVS